MNPIYNYYIQLSMLDLHTDAIYLKWCTYYLLYMLSVVVAEVKGRKKNIYGVNKSFSVQSLLCYLKVYKPSLDLPT